MEEIKMPDNLWATNIMPEGALERWLVADGSVVKTGDPVASVRIEESLHEILSPAEGRITFVAAANGMIEPGTVIARVDPSARDQATVSADTGA